MLRILAVLVWGSVAAWGQCSSSSAVFPHLVDGGGWKSSIYLVNDSASAAANYTLTFRGDGAQPTLLSFTDGRRDNQISGTIAGGGLAILETPGLDSGPLTAATASLTTTGPISGFSVIREKITGQPDREVTIPLANAVARGLVFPFDNTGGFQSSIALTVLCGASTTVALTAVAMDEAGGTLGQSEMKMPRGGHAAFMTSDQLPGTKGKRGLIRIGSGTGVQLAGIGLRVGAGGALTYFPPSTGTVSAVKPVARPVRRPAKK